MSDIHGCYYEFLDVLEYIDLSSGNMLILLGDYIHGPMSYEVLDKIMQLQDKYGEDKVIALMGNHEQAVVNGEVNIKSTKAFEYDDEADTKEMKYIDWMVNLPKYYETDKQIFVHSGVEEKARSLWEWETDDDTYLWKHYTLGKFYKTIIAGHTHTSEIAEDEDFNEVYFDGKSHYYIDGNTLDTGIINVLRYDTETSEYTSLQDGEFVLVEHYNRY